MPLAWALALGRLVARVWYYVLPVRKRVAARNIRLVYGDELSDAEQKRILKEAFLNFGMYGAELLRLPFITREISDGLVERENFDILDDAIARGNGVIVPTAHLDNWDLLGCSQALRGVPLNVIVKSIGWKAAHDFVFAVRHRCGFKTIGTRKTSEEIKAALGRGEVVAMIIDQHMVKHRGIVCDLFGYAASTTPAVARFAYETGAAIVPAVMKRLDNNGRHRVIVEPEFFLESPHAERAQNIRHNTERLNRMLEGWIRRAPEQWLWHHRRWKVHEDPRGWEVPPALSERTQNISS